MIAGVLVLLAYTIALCVVAALTNWRTAVVIPGSLLWIAGMVGLTLMGWT